MALVPVWSPETDSELVVVVALLDAHGIYCFVHNAGFGSLMPGMQVNAYNTRRVFVPAEQVTDALHLLSDFAVATTGPRLPEPMRWCDKLRIIFEGVVFGWFVPGSRFRRQRVGMASDNRAAARSRRRAVRSQSSFGRPGRG